MQMSPDQANELAKEANTRLQEAYENFAALEDNFRSRGRIEAPASIPCFLDVQPQYFAAATRIVFVGQETHGWWTEWSGAAPSLTVPKITDFYRKIRPELLREYRSPYWQAVRKVATQLAIAEPESSVVFSNIFPCDVDKRQAPQELLKAFRLWRVLPDELEILRPEYVIFFVDRFIRGTYSASSDHRSWENSASRLQSYLTSLWTLPGRAS